MRTRSTAFAPATVANVAVGFDILGFSLNIAGDEVSIEKISQPEVQLSSMDGVVSGLPLEAHSNTAAAGLVQLVKDLQLPFGFRVSVKKGIPLGSGMGGSAASAVAAVVAANALLDTPLSQERMLHYALIGEAVASGSFHADNIAPCLLGGLVLSKIGGDKNSSQVPWVECTSIPIPKGLFCVLIHPHLRVDTRDSRKILKPTISLKQHVAQAAHLGGFLAACFNSDPLLMRKSFIDLVVEPQRAALIPGFHAIQAAALAAGALGCSIAGSGPSLFAWTLDAKSAELVEKSMLNAAASVPLQCDSWRAPLDLQGARLLP